MISRERQLEVTDLTLASVRTSDPRLVSITGTTLQGHHPGTADIQVQPVVFLWHKGAFHARKESIVGEIKLLATYLLFQKIVLNKANLGRGSSVFDILQF